MLVRVSVPYEALVMVDVWVSDDLDEGGAWDAAKEEARMVARLEVSKDCRTLSLPRWSEAEIAEIEVDWTFAECEVVE